MENRKIVLENIKKIHLIGIGGIGMSGLAILLKDRGFYVQGSDIKTSANLKRIRDKGIKVFIGHDSSYIDSFIDLVVFSSAIREDNPEIKEAKRRGIPLLARSYLLSLLMDERELICVAGSHGKTTVSGMLSWVLSQGGLEISGFVGGHFLRDMSYAWEREGRMVVLETDESDASFLNFTPFIGIVTNIDREHINFYGSFQSLYDAFRRFLKKSRIRIACREDNNFDNLSLEFPDILSYGFSQATLVGRIKSENYPFIFDCFLRDKYLGEFELNLLGRHNVLNSLSCILVASELGFRAGVIREALLKFPGIKRRLEFRGEYNKVKFYDDYAHHPQEIKASLRALRETQPERLVTIFQPHRYSRLKDLFGEFLYSFEDASFVILTDIYSAQEENLDGISSLRLYQEWKSMGKNNVIYLKKDQIKEFLLGNFLREGDCLVSMGAGDIYIVLDDILRSFSDK